MGPGTPTAHRCPKGKAVGGPQLVTRQTTARQTTSFETNVRYNNQVLTTTWNLTWKRSSATITWQARSERIRCRLGARIKEESRTIKKIAQRCEASHPGEDQPGDRTHQAERDRAHQDPQNHYTDRIVGVSIAVQRKVTQNQTTHRKSRTKRLNK